METQTFKIGTKFMTELGLYIVTARAIMAQKWVVQNEKNLGNNNFTLYSEKELNQMLESGKIKLA